MAGETKTEKATPKKRRDERKKGNVFLSKDAVTVVTLFASFVMLRALATSIVLQMKQFLEYSLTYAAQGAQGGTEGMLNELLKQFCLVLAKTVGPLLGVTAVAAVVATFAQTRMLVSGELMKPKFSRINPLEGFKRIFSLRSLIEALKGIIKIVVLLYLIYSSLRGAINDLMKLIYTEVSASCQYLFLTAFSMVMRIGIAFIALAALDFLYQWWDYERQMKMSKQEVKEEYKQTEGDPQIKGKIKENQRRMAQQRMMQQVPQADVVVRNPDHFAVALRYDPNIDKAPFVLAKGMDELALRIVKVAQEHNIPAIENVPLARGLYANAELNQEIPPEFYGEVAEVLVYLYRMDPESGKVTKS